MVAKAKVRIEGEDATAAAWNSALARGKKAADQTAGAWRAALGGISVASIVGLARRQIELGDALANGAKYAGMAGKEFSSLAYAAKLADVEVQDLSTAIKKMQVTISQAASGSKAQVETLDAIGLSAKRLKSLDPGEQIEIIAEHVRALGAEEDRTRALQEIFGKSGAQLKPLFEEGAEGIRRAREEAEQLGLAFSDEQLQALAKADDSIKRLTASWDGFAAVLVSKVAPSLSWTFDRLAGAPIELHERIADLEEQLASARGTRGMSAETQRAAIRAQLEQLRAAGVAQSSREMGIGGSGSGPTVPGFGSSGDAKALEQRQKDFDALVEAMGRASLAAREMDNELNQALDDHSERLAENVEDHFDHVGDELEALAIDQADVLSETGEIWKDTWLSAWDDMINTGKVSWDELLKYMLAQLARRGMSNLFDSLIGAASGSGGFWGSLFSGMFGGKRDSGGRGSPGQVYAIGTGAQPELFVPDSAGSFYPRGSGGGLSVAIHQTVINQNPTADFVKEFPKVLKRSNDALKADIIDGIQRGRYAI